MKLLMISTDRKIFEEGSAVRARQIEYAKKFEEVHIIVFAQKGDIPRNEMPIAPNAWAYSTQSSSKLKYPFDAIRLGRFIVKSRGITDITCQDPFLTAMAGVSLKKEFGLSLEIQVHTDIGSPYFNRTIGNRVRKMLAMRYLPQADRVRVVSGRIKKYVESIAPDRAIEVRPIAVDVEAIKRAPITTDLHKKYSFRKIVLMASRLEPEKNIQLAIHSWKEVIQTVPDAGLIIVGSGSQVSYLKKRINRLAISKSVIIENWVDRNTLASYYKTADLFLNTSWYEGYGMTLVEAQAAGVKIVSTDVGVAREVGATIVPFEQEAIAQTIKHALV